MTSNTGNVGNVPVPITPVPRSLTGSKISDMLTNSAKRKCEELDSTSTKRQKLLSSYFTRPAPEDSVFGVSPEAVFQELPASSTITLSEVPANNYLLVLTSQDH